jgi:hypothetical protein
MRPGSVYVRRIGAIVLCALGLAVASGCGGGPKRVPVSGEATLDGEPLKAGVLNFFPDDAKGNPHRVACLSPMRNGKYNLMTTAVRDSETGSGAPLGWYKVYLDTTKIHPRFIDPLKTPISVEVVEKPAEGAYTIKFTSK